MRTDRALLKRQVAASRTLLTLIHTRSLRAENAATDTEQAKDALQRLEQATEELAREVYAPASASASAEENGALSELRAAHQIIRNALNIMTLRQKNEWAERNEQDGCDGEGATRANERESVIARLEASEKAQTQES